MATDQQMKSKNNITITLGIPTCYGGIGLLRTVKSILKSAKDYPKFEFLIFADSVPFPDELKNKLIELGVKLKENNGSESQLAKIGQIISNASGEILILTQDDVRFGSKTVDEIVKKFQTNDDVGMVTVNIQPEPSESFMERVVLPGSNISYLISQLWNKGDNYLAANGRCLAFNIEDARKMRMPNKLVNSDAYIYFEMKRIRSKVVHASKAIVYNRNPQNIHDFLKQAGRFRISQFELVPYFNFDLCDFYRIPKSISFRAFIQILIKNPFYTFCYIFLLIFSRQKKTNFEANSNVMWEAATSTKSK